MSDPLSALRDQALRETLKRVYATGPIWHGAPGNTKLGKMQRDAEKRGFVVDTGAKEPRYSLTPKGRWFADG